MRAGVLREAWDTRVGGWHRHVYDSSSFELVRAAVLAHADPHLDQRVVDLGAGTGFLTFALAPFVADVLAVDISPAMLAVLAVRAEDEGLGTVRCFAADLAALELPAASVDLVVSNYALHHLVDGDKVALVERVRTWLTPGGRLVIADMMFGRGRTPQDRAIIRQKVRALVGKGPGGIWRIVKNVVRFGLRRGTELPSSPGFWVKALEHAGFTSVEYRAIVAEAGLVVGVAPPVTGHHRPG
jgi:ubiquinone/menaquinone biosynthesis C-methylase UbiE